MNCISTLLIILLSCLSTLSFATDSSPDKPDFLKLRNQRLQTQSDIDGIKAERLNIQNSIRGLPPSIKLEDYIKEDEEYINQIQSKIDIENNKKPINIDIIEKLKSDMQRQRSTLDRDKRDFDMQTKAEKQLDTLQSTLKTKEQDLFDVDNKISDALSRDVVAQNFKSQISLYFALLVGFMILCFFGVAFYDQSVRITIFSGQAGIQFVTLFSLIIAIILFGITGILEDKELAALLGGLSGYILGRYNQTEKTNPP